MGKKTATGNSGGACHNLAEDDVKRVEAFMAVVTRAFERADPDVLDTLYHEGDDADSRRAAHEYMQTLMKRGDRVRCWQARPYTEPKWSIMRRFQHHPSPSIWIE